MSPKSKRALALISFLRSCWRQEILDAALCNLRGAHLIIIRHKFCCPKEIRCHVEESFSIPRGKDMSNVIDHIPGDDTRILVTMVSAVSQYLRSRGVWSVEGVGECGRGCGNRTVGEGWEGNQRGRAEHCGIIEDFRQKASRELHRVHPHQLPLQVEQPAVKVLRDLERNVGGPGRQVPVCREGIIQSLPHPWVLCAVKFGPHHMCCGLRWNL